MIELNKLTWLGGIIGAFVILISTIKWFFLAPDPSQMLFGYGIGISIGCFAYIYECLKMGDKTVVNINLRLDELEFWARTKGFE